MNLDSPLILLLLWTTLGHKAICAPQFVRTVRFDNFCYSRSLFMEQTYERLV